MKNAVVSFIFLIFLAAVSVWFSERIYQNGAADALSAEDPESMAFRRMQLSENTLKKIAEISAEGSVRVSDILTVLRAFGGRQRLDGAADSAGWVIRWRSILSGRNRGAYEKIRKCYAAVWDDLKCFPSEEPCSVFENSWMFERTYGGKRWHEGTDLIPPENVAGMYPVRSITDGTVEKIGWLPLGGWRIGIRSPSGGYFYYAHLDSYGRPFQIGEEIRAGEILGRMGDTGYGEEGTRGKFDVHLHLGIYIQTESKSEISVNPYWVLRYLQILEMIRKK